MENDLENKNSLFLKIIVSMVAVVLILNLAYLDIFIFKGNKSQEQKTQISTNVSAPTSTYANSVCPNSCLNQIYEATSASKVTPQTAISIAPIAAPTPTVALISAPQVKEFFIPLGSGTNSSDDWEDIAGLKVSIDSSNYLSIKSIVFEASISVPSGDQATYVRLFNETDKHPVWFSDVSMNGGTPQLLISKPITLDSGNKTYKVQMKTSMKYQAVLNQARIHIIIK